MREIKFRAWNPISKELRTDVVIHLHKDGHFWVSSWYDFSDGDVDDNGWEMFGDSKIDNIVLMQYTGIKDKNGTPIFEGDILATSNDGTDGADVWSKEDYGYAVVREDTDNLFDGVRCKNWYPTEDNTEVYNVGYVEVIGNIYENPDLMP